MSVGRRLVEERERLGMTQAAFFTACGVSKKAQFNFENDHNIPGGAYLIAAAAIGVDIAYVLTGQRVGGAMAAAPHPISALPPRQRALLDNYEHTDESGRKIIEAAASAAAQSKGSGTGRRSA
ncbi:helix-turn-helix transcriptional regulator [Ramlibacter sp. H39-3-26]|uniref:helix-turn-helix domain-containing protein n=1 Tax=Curvibacter soli TaxID=3031331 RepID=UPI0023DCC0EB|nr:helix-turn-helix transcriptional regulator [Ramlibacter sp. H39-3-26]MDF1483713.1 helix-turn-helix transcriptional regulator [Ramlibacter sp. H39-3-26]